MRKTVLEFFEEDGKWIRYEASYSRSRQGNFYIKHEGKVYVFKNFENGTPVLTKNGDGWEKVGRISHHYVFVGPDDKPSYYDWLESPEGEEATRRFLQSLREEV